MLFAILFHPFLDHFIHQFLNSFSLPLYGMFLQVLFKLFKRFDFPYSIFIMILTSIWIKPPADSRACLINPAVVVAIEVFAPVLNI